MTDLLPCPFCGAKPVSGRVWGDGVFRIACENFTPLANGPNDCPSVPSVRAFLKANEWNTEAGWGRIEREAIAAWNRRAQPTEKHGGTRDVLPRDVDFGGVVFHEGVKWSTMINAVKRWRSALGVGHEKYRAVYEAARGLCYGFDWNNGTHAKRHKAALIAAVDAIEPLPDRARVREAGAQPTQGAVASDRSALLYLMQQFDGQVHVCERCGEEDETKNFDSAVWLRDYLASHPAPVGVTEEMVERACAARFTPGAWPSEVSLVTADIERKLMRAALEAVVGIGK